MPGLHSSPLARAGGVVVEILRAAELVLTPQFPEPLTAEWNIASSRDFWSRMIRPSLAWLFCDWHFLAKQQCELRKIMGRLVFSAGVMRAAKRTPQKGHLLFVWDTCFLEPPEAFCWL